jgi:UDP-N-acetylglucosamine transferase subunit ALG13
MATTAGQKPLVFATVGTDHHRFDRLVHWLDRWQEAGGDGRVRVVVQVGTSARPEHGEATDYLEYEAMKRAMRDAALVVCHGGPGTMMIAAAAGHRPIVVPRVSALGEHVDDHQVAFARRMAHEGVIALAETEEQFRALLEEALRNPASARAPKGAASVDAATNRFGTLIERLVAGKDGGDDQVRVLYIGGMGRSGSTLLDLLLGQIPSLVPVGELRFLWRRGLGQNQLCGCGRPFRDCPFWQAVGREAFGGWEHLDVEEMIDLERRVDRHRFLPFMLLPGLWPRYARRLHRYAQVLSDLYRGIAKASGGSVVVDSTKDPPFAFLLRHVPGVDVRLLHLVRDSRGVAYSWTKVVEKPERTDKVEHMDVYSPAGMGLRWIVYNALIDVLHRMRMPHLLVRYEELVADPQTHLAQIMRLAGEELAPGDLAFLQNGSVELGVQHTVAGNPMRFSRGRIALRVDDAWRTKLPLRQQWLLYAITWPLMRRYGYRR